MRWISECRGGTVVGGTYIRDAEVSERLVVLVRRRWDHGLRSWGRGGLARSRSVGSVGSVLEGVGGRMGCDRSGRSWELCSFSGRSGTGSRSRSCLLLVGPLDSRSENMVNTAFLCIHTLRVSLVSFLPLGAGLLVWLGVGGALPPVWGDASGPRPVLGPATGGAEGGGIAPRSCGVPTWGWCAGECCGAIGCPCCHCPLGIRWPALAGIG